MRFPLLNISIDNWIEEDVLEYFQHDEFIYTDDQNLFNKYCRDKLFCDSNGEIFKVTGRILNQNKWRKIFRFLPNFYKHSLIFEKTNQRMSLEELREYILNKIQGLEKNDYSEEWMNKISKAKDFEGIING